MHIFRKFCKPPSTSAINLKVSPKRAWELLADPKYRGVDTADLIYLANEKVKGVLDRATAIAVLKGAY